MSSILRKNELENVNFCPCLLGQKFFIHFLGELKKPKKPFEKLTDLYIGQIYGVDFAKICGLLRIYELYKQFHPESRSMNCTETLV